MSLHRALSIFKTFRTLIFAICMILSIGCGTMLTIVLLREWHELNLITRIIVVVLAVVHLVGAILIYLMIVVRFTVRSDIARVLVYFSLVTGGAVLFISGRARLPCSSSGIGKICGQATLSLIIGSLIISGLLLCYLIGLGIIVHTIPGPLLVRAPADVLEGGLTSINSATGLLTEKSGSRDHPGHDYDGGHPNSHSARHRAPQPLNLVDPSEGQALRPPFNYRVTNSPSTASLSTPMTSRPHRRAERVYDESPPASALSYSPYSSESTPLTHSSSQFSYPVSPSLNSVSSIKSVSTQRTYEAQPVGDERQRRPHSRWGSAQSAPPFLGVPSQTDSLRPLPNPFTKFFQDAVSRTSTPSTPNSVTGSTMVSLSFGSRGFPLPPSYNATAWSQYTRDYLHLSASSRPQTPMSTPSTPLSLRPGVHTTKQLSPSIIQPRRPVSFGSVSASLHSMTLPSPPAPAARLPPHPRLQAHLEASRVESDPTIPLTAKTFGSQLLPTDIPVGLASGHQDSERYS